MKLRPSASLFLTVLCAFGIAAAAARKPPPPSRLAGQTTPALRQMLKTEREPTRYEAVKALAARTLKDGAVQADAVAGLLRALGDSACVVRFKAAEGLANTGSAVVPQLTEALKDSRRDVRAAAARALRAMGAEAKQAVPALVSALEDKDYQVRRWSADALGIIGPDAAAALPALTRCLGDAERTVREAAAGALARIDAEGAIAVPALAKATRDRAADVREAICQELVKLGPKAAAAMPALLERLEDDEWQVRLSAGEALLSIDAELKPSVAALSELFAAETRPFMKAALFRSLAARKVGPEAAPIAPHAIERLKGKQAEVKAAQDERHRKRIERDRDNLVVLLGRIGPGARDAAPVLRELLADKSTAPESRKKIEEALKNIGG